MAGPGPRRCLFLPDAERQAWSRDRKGALIGRQLADQYGFKVGDVLPIRGTIYPGTWEFVVQAIYDGADAKTDTSQFFFHWDYLNETLKKTVPRRANTVGVYIIGIDQASRAAAVSADIDQLFRNSLAETLTETEKAFQLGFVAMTEAIDAATPSICTVILALWSASWRYIARPSNT